MSTGELTQHHSHILTLKDVKDDRIDRLDESSNHNGLLERLLWFLYRLTVPSKGSPSIQAPRTSIYQPANTDSYDIDQYLWPPHRRIPQNPRLRMVLSGP